jgi:hypothetical protein
VRIATTARQKLIVQARRFPKNPFDGHTLAKQVEQATSLMQDMALVPETVYVDRGVRLRKEDRLSIRTLLPDMKHLMTEEERKLIRMILQKGIKPFLCLFFSKEIRALFENLKQIAAGFQTNPINHHLRLAWK